MRVNCAFGKRALLAGITVQATPVAASKCYCGIARQFAICADGNDSLATDCR